MKRNFKNLNFRELIKERNFWISCISFSLLISVLSFIIVDGLNKSINEGVSGFIEQSNLRKSLGEWYQLVFYTFQINIYFLTIGTLLVFFKDNNLIKNLLFCSSSYLLLCFLALAVFKIRLIVVNPYETIKTLIVHGIVPIFSFVSVYLIREEIQLKWKTLWINSSYLTIYIIMTIIIYYNVDFATNTSHPGEPLWIYAFLDYDNQIMFIPLPGLVWTIIGIITLLIATPFIAMLIFILMKIIFQLNIEKTHWEKFDQIINFKLIK